MKVQYIKHGVTLEGLEDWGTTGLPDTPVVKLSGVKKLVRGSEHIDTGIFECTPGTYRRAVKQGEVMHFLSGSGQFTPDGEDTIRFTSGDTMFFEANTEGTWQIDETMRKVYVIF